jgi:DNA-binding NarL/FixJ family response regulator
MLTRHTRQTVRSSSSSGKPSALTNREQQVLRLLLAGDGEKRIASRMRLSPHTVHEHVKSLYRKLRVNSRIKLFLKMRRTSVVKR